MCRLCRSATVSVLFQLRSVFQASIVRVHRARAPGVRHLRLSVVLTLLASFVTHCAWTDDGAARAMQRAGGRTDRAAMAAMLLLLCAVGVHAMATADTTADHSPLQLVTTHSQLLSLTLTTTADETAATATAASSPPPPPPLHLLALSYTMTFDQPLWVGVNTTGRTSVGDDDAAFPMRLLSDDDERGLNDAFRLECPGVGAFSAAVPRGLKSALARRGDFPSIESLRASPQDEQQWKLFLWTQQRQEDMHTLWLALFQSGHTGNTGSINQSTAREHSPRASCPASRTSAASQSTNTNTEQRS